MSELGYSLCEEKKDCAEGVKMNQEVLERHKRVLGPEAHYTRVTMDNWVLSGHCPLFLAISLPLVTDLPQ